MKILLIDDDELLLLGLSYALHDEGFAVIVAENGEQGFEAAQRIKPDLIICDVMMPLLNGLQLKQRLNQDETLAHIPLIFLSGRDKQEDINFSLSLGAEGYLIKPVMFCNILDKIKSVLKLHRRRDE